MKLNIRIKPNSRKGPLVEKTNDSLIVYVRELAVDGQANEAVVKLLAKYYHVSKTCIKIIHGAKSRRKIIDIIQ